MEDGDRGSGVHRLQPRVHYGFMRSLLQSGLYQGVYDALCTLRAELGGELPRFYVSGHSLGAAMAALAVPMLQRDFAPVRLRLFTFGCPRTGNAVRSCCWSAACVAVVAAALPGSE